GRETTRDDPRCVDRRRRPRPVIGTHHVEDRSRISHARRLRQHAGYGEQPRRCLDGFALVDGLRVHQHQYAEADRRPDGLPDADAALEGARYFRDAGPQAAVRCGQLTGLQGRSSVPRGDHGRVDECAAPLNRRSGYNRDIRASRHSPTNAAPTPTMTMPHNRPDRMCQMPASARPATIAAARNNGAVTKQWNVRLRAAFSTQATPRAVSRRASPNGSSAGHTDRT